MVTRKVHHAVHLPLEQPEYTTCKIMEYLLMNDSMR
jgi:hypothetical protein